MDPKKDILPVNIIIFDPTQWGEVTKFRRFAPSTYNLDSSANAALSGVEGHIQKYNILMGLAQRIVPKLVEDKEELIKQGYSNAIRSKELAAIVETLFCELYSCVDCTRQVIGAIYGNLPGVTKKSTSKLFKNAVNGDIDERVPVEIRKALAEAEWFPRFEKIRNAIIHSNVGSCSEDKGQISYFHERLGIKKNNVLAIKDVFQEVTSCADNINKFLGLIFQTLNYTLKDEATPQFCGIFGGRLYERFVSPHKALNSHSGKCKSYEWFEEDMHPTCPFVKNCGAYAKVLEERASMSRNTIKL